jgi:hypothetical protein
MHVLRAVIVLFAAGMLLSGCTPRQDIELYNDTGAAIIVTAFGQSVSVAPHSSTRFAFILARDQHWESVSITRHGTRWTYPQTVFARIPETFWHHEAFDARRAYVVVDSRGRIHLLSPATPTGPRPDQPAGFPISPTRKT